jgi:hypothetical protein
MPAEIRASEIGCKHNVSRQSADRWIKNWMASGLERSEAVSAALEHGNVAKDRACSVCGEAGHYGKRGDKVICPKVEATT